MYLMIWAPIGLIAGWIVRHLLAEKGYGAFVNNAVAITGAITAASLAAYFANPVAPYQLECFDLAAVLGATVLTGITTLIVGRRRLV